MAKKHQLLLSVMTSILLFIATSCNNDGSKFDKNLWNDRDVAYLNRASMVDDLMENHLHKGMKYAEIIQLIGLPDNLGSNKADEIVYAISVDYGKDIDPIRGENLIFKLSSDSTILNFRLEKWNH